MSARTIDPRHTTLVCPRGHGPMEPVDAPAGEAVRRFECLACRCAGSAPAAAFTPPAARRRAAARREAVPA